jgi:nucleotide-binding universal stress UspA family protein
MTHSFKRLLVAVDLSPCSAAGLDLALCIARVHQSSIEALFVAHGEHRPLASAETEELQRFIEAAKPGDVSVALHIELGDVRERIVSLAETLGCDAIVLGTHGRSGRVHALAGSVAEGVVRTATCPVVTVREPA